MKNKVLFFAISILAASTLKAQVNVGSTSAADPSAILQATSTTKGFLPPVLTTLQRNQIVTPATGLTIFNITTNQQEINTGTTTTPMWGVNTAINLYNRDGALTSSRTVTQGTNALSFLGTGGILLKSGNIDVDSSALIGKGDSIGSVIGIGVRSNGGINIGQNTVGNNIYIGFMAGAVTTGTLNQFIGYHSGKINTTGNFNQFSGYQSGLVNTTGSQNLFTGFQSGNKNTTGSNNQFSGTKSGYNNTTGNSNYFSGYQSGLNNTTATGNHFEGSQSGYSNTTGADNNFIGFQSGFFNTTGSQNKFSGNFSGYQNTTGRNNQFDGLRAGQNNTTGEGNQFTGLLCGASNTTGVNNQFDGFQCGYSNTIGGENLYNGYQSGYSGTTGSKNVFVGLQSGLANTSGSQNQFIGWKSGYNNSTGTNNTFVGYLAGANITTGYDNISVGSGSGPAIANLFNTVAIGYGATISTNNAVVIGNTNTTTIGGYSPWTVLSDARFKYNIKSNVLGLAFIKKLRPVTYQIDTKKLDAFTKNGVLNASFIEDNNATMHTGFLAQDVEKVADELGISFDGVHKPENDNDHYSLAYAQFVVPLVKAVQEQQVQIEKLIVENQLISAQLADMKELKIAMAAMRRELNKVVVATKSVTSSIASN